MTEPIPDLLSRLAAFGLPGNRPLRAEPLDAAQWDSLTTLVVSERMEGVLVTSVKAAALSVTDDQLASVREIARGRARVDLLLERETLRAVRVLESAGVPYRLLKGPAWAHSAYPDPMLRGFGDVDILIAPSGWYQAIEALESSGSERSLPEIRPGFDGRFGKDATLVAASGLEIDLHRTLVLGPYGLWIDAAELFSRPPCTVRLGGAEVAVLDAEAAFVHACYNAALCDDPPRMAALRDIAQMAMEGSADPKETRSLAERWKGVAVVRRAVQLTAARLDLPVRQTPLAQAFATGAARWRDRALLASYRGPGRGYTSQLAGVAAISGVRAKGAYLAALARPQPSYLRARGLSATGFLKHAGRRVGGR